MELEVILGVVATIATAVAGWFGFGTSKVKKKLNKALTLLIESSEAAAHIKIVAEDVKDAIADDKLTKEEMQDGLAKLEALIAELDDVKVAFKDLIAKEA